MTEGLRKLHLHHRAVYFAGLQFVGECDKVVAEHRVSLRVNTQRCVFVRRSIVWLVWLVFQLALFWL